jgi:hypothetical protein
MTLKAFVYRFCQVQPSLKMLATVLTFALATCSLSHATGSSPCPNDCICIERNSALSIQCGSEKSGNSDSFIAGIRGLLEDYQAKGLSMLNISSSPLADIPPSICKTSASAALSFRMNGISCLPTGCFKNMPNLVKLDLSFNEITIIQDGLFDGLRTLVELYLSNNKIVYIGPYAFSSESSFPNLRKIDLSYNYLTELDPWPIIRLMAVADTVTIDLSNNVNISFTNRIGWHFSCPPLPQVPSPQKEIMLCDGNFRHVTDLLKGWHLTLSDLACLAQNQTVSINVSNTPISCDCTDFEYYKQFTNTPGLGHNQKNIFTNMLCYDPPTLRYKNPLDVALRKFVCTINQHHGCPQGCSCSNQPSRNRLLVKCLSSSFSSMPSLLPTLPPKSKTTYDIRVVNNYGLQKLEYRSYMADVSHFELRDSALRMIDGMGTWALLFSTKTLILSGNYLESIPLAVGSFDIVPHKLGLGNNRWRCLSDNCWMIGWLNKIYNHLQHPNEILCYDTTPPVIWQNETCGSTTWAPTTTSITSAASTPDTTSTASTTSRTSTARTPGTTSTPSTPITTDTPGTPGSTTPIKTLMLTGFVLLVTSLVFIAVYRNRFRLFVRYKFHPFDRDNCTGEQMEYDVFVSCSSEGDRELGSRLVDLLEANNYKVCYHERDFDIGDTIENNMSRAIERSKRTVCVITENFLRRFIFDVFDNGS